MKVSLFYLPSVGSRAQVEQGMVGLRGDLYTQMLQELGEQDRGLPELALTVQRDAQVAHRPASVGVRRA